jgi:5'-nucleotidase
MDPMKGRKPIVLLANDDGIQSEGLTAMEAALPESWDVYVVAPDRARNAASHALTLGAPIRLQELGNKRFSTSGTPTDCVNIGVHRLLPRKPDLVLSGINIGGNLCEDVTYSGTVAAALEARLLDIPSVAFSLAARDRFFFAPAARVACSIARTVLEKGLPPGRPAQCELPQSGGRIARQDPLDPPGPESVR